MGGQGRGVVKSRGSNELVSHKTERDTMVSNEKSSLIGRKKEKQKQRKKDIWYINSYIHVTQYKFNSSTISNHQRICIEIRSISDAKFLTHIRNSFQWFDSKVKQYANTEAMAVWFNRAVSFCINLFICAGAVRAGALSKINCDTSSSLYVVLRIIRSAPIASVKSKLCKVKQNKSLTHHQQT